MSAKERFLAAHRDAVNGAFKRRLSVMGMLIALYAFDFAYLILAFTSNHFYTNAFRSDIYMIHCIIHAALTVLSLIHLIPGTFWLYLSLPIHFLKIWHIPFVWGIMTARLALYLSRNLGTRTFSLLGHSAKLLFRTGSTFAIVLSFLKPVQCSFIIWYALVLERIRAANGTGWEKKSAMELELEAKTAEKPQGELEINVLQ